VRVVKNLVSVGIDTSGEALFRRGYRKELVEAPLKEHLAAGLILMSGWDQNSPIIDPMCGSGTLLIEAALIAHRVAPGTFRERFSFQNFAHFEEEVWDKLVGQAVASEIPELDFQFYGYDEDAKAVRAARTNAAAAGVGSSLQITRNPVDHLVPPVEAGLIITNPPYGARLGNEEVAKDTYRDLSFALKSHFKGWTCWILAGNAEYLEALRLKSSLKIRLFNGPIECRFLRYDMR
jgi:putative N6-adenine-specific DNA methylase